MKEGSPAKAGEIKGESAVVLGERRPDRQPVHGSSAQPVDHEQRLTFSPEVEELDRPVQVYSPMPHCVNGTPSGPSLRDGPTPAALALD